MIYVSAPATAATRWWPRPIWRNLQRVYLNVSQDEEGMRRLFRQFSFPGIGSHACAPRPRLHQQGRAGLLWPAFGAMLA